MHVTDLELKGILDSGYFTDGEKNERRIRKSRTHNFCMCMHCWIFVFIRDRTISSGRLWNVSFRIYALNNVFKVYISWNVIIIYNRLNSIKFHIIKTVIYKYTHPQTSSRGSNSRNDPGVWLVYSDSTRQAEHAYICEIFQQVANSEIRALRSCKYRPRVTLFRL